MPELPRVDGHDGLRCLDPRRASHPREFGVAPRTRHEGLEGGRGHARNRPTVTFSVNDKSGNRSTSPRSPPSASFWPGPTPTTGLARAASASPRLRPKPRHQWRVHIPHDQQDPRSGDRLVHGFSRSQQHRNAAAGHDECDPGHGLRHAHGVLLQRGQEPDGSPAPGGLYPEVLRLPQGPELHPQRHARTPPRNASSATIRL